MYTITCYVVISWSTLLSSKLNGCIHLSVMCFTAKGEWTAAMEPLHKDVDLRKQHRCGVGPALVSLCWQHTASLLCFDGTNYIQHLLLMVMVISHSPPYHYLARDHAVLFETTAAWNVTKTPQLSDRDFRRSSHLYKQRMILRSPVVGCVYNSMTPWRGARPRERLYSVIFDTEVNTVVRLWLM